MALDINARRSLELTERMRDKSKKGTLIWVLDKTSTSMGGRLLRRWLNDPLINVDEINNRWKKLQNLSECAVRYVSDFSHNRMNNTVQCILIIFFRLFRIFFGRKNIVTSEIFGEILWASVNIHCFKQRNEAVCIRLGTAYRKLYRFAVSETVTFNEHGEVIFTHKPCYERCYRSKKLNKCIFKCRNILIN